MQTVESSCWRTLAYAFGIMLLYGIRTFMMCLNCFRRNNEFSDFCEERNLHALICNQYGGQPGASPNSGPMGHGPRITGHGEPWAMAPHAPIHGSRNANAPIFSTLRAVSVLRSSRKSLIYSDSSVFKFMWFSLSFYLVVLINIYANVFHVILCYFVDIWYPTLW